MTDRLCARHGGRRRINATGRNGADLTLETADFVAIRDELATIPAVVALARRARRVVIANLAIAATFIVTVGSRGGMDRALPALPPEKLTWARLWASPG
ncbi:hypothetical protein AU191_20280 [Mycolicibacterium acapulense]|nr:hypothetical protein AU191_20280 [Mycolicibacterium acapulense]